MATALYLSPDAKLPYCRGCGHALVVRQLSRALEELKLAPRSVALTTDIGCVGLADSLFPYLHTVHTTHGRSTAFATGMALADTVLEGQRLKPIVMIGDGGAMIGLLHLVHAAQLNVDVTVLVHNNFLFGMTGGQHSALTPLEWVTATTPEGNSTPPLDLLALLRTAHAGFLARQFATSAELSATIADAIAYPGFSVVEIVELCPAYAARWNRTTGAALEELIRKQGYVIGRLETEYERPMFQQLYKQKLISPAAEAQSSDVIPSAARNLAAKTRAGRDSSSPAAPRNDTPQVFFSSLGQQPLAGSARLDREIHVVVAGSAGERVQSAAGLLCRVALAAGIYSTQKNDNPVTQGSGFSLSEITLSPRPIDYTGLESADVVIVASDEGWRELNANGTLAACRQDTLLLVDSAIESTPPAGRVQKFPLRGKASPKRAALAGIAAWLELNPVLPREAWDAALAAEPEARRAEGEAALELGRQMARADL